MLQRGIEITSLDVGYVSTLSWYFLTMFGLQGITGLIVSNHAGTIPFFSLVFPAPPLRLRMGALTGPSSTAVARDALGRYAQGQCSADGCEASIRAR